MAQAEERFLFFRRKQLSTLVPRCSKTLYAKCWTLLTCTFSQESRNTDWENVFSRRGDIITPRCHCSFYFRWSSSLQNSIRILYGCFLTCAFVKCLNDPFRATLSLISIFISLVDLWYVNFIEVYKLIMN